MHFNKLYNIQSTTKPLITHRECYYRKFLLIGFKWRLQIRYSEATYY